MTPEQFKALRTAEDNLTAMLCDPEGKCCISGSDADRRIIDDALDILRALAAEPAPEAVAVALRIRLHVGVLLQHADLVITSRASFKVLETAVRVALGLHVFPFCVCSGTGHALVSPESR